MSDPLKAMYQEIILKHNKQPIRKEPAPNDWLHGEGRNTTCGDEVRLALRLDENQERVLEARFQGASCAICTASASMMMDAISGQTRAEIASLSEQLDAAFSQGEKLDPEKHGDLHALNGVHAFPARLKCASLPWEVLETTLGKLNSD